MPTSPHADQQTTRLLAGRRILVTGAAGAIGGAIAASMERHGAEVVATDRRDGAASLVLDVVDENSVSRGFAEAGSLTDVVHCAGSLIVGPIAETSLASFREAVDIHLCGAFLVGREAARRLPRGGSLTMIASQAGYRAGANWGVYCAVKAGVMRLCEALAQELGTHGIRVNSVCPGSVASPMSDDALIRLSRVDGRLPDQIRDRNVAGIPLGRYSEPREIADVCVFLASPLASYVSGASIPVDGGEVSA